MQASQQLFLKKVAQYLALLVLLFGLCVGKANATVRYVKVGGTGAAPYTSWATAGGNWQTIVSASASGDSVFVAAGTYLPASGQSFSMKQGVKIFGGFPTTGTPTFTQRNWEANITTLQGNGSRVINNNSNGLTAIAELDGFTITGGLLNADGGGMLNAGSSPTIRNCKFIANAANNNYGGGIYNNNSSPSIINCEFAFNGAYNGAGMYNVNNSSPLIVGCSFTSNMVSGNGGGLRNVTNSSPTIISCRFVGNTAGLGGGISSTSNCSTKLTNVLITGNKASIGGGIHKADGGTDTLINCTLAGNYANANGGGGIYTTGSTNTITVLKNSIAYDNIGGDILNSGGVITVSNSAYGTVVAPGAITNFGNNLTTNPLFVNAVPATSAAATTAGNYQLQPCSPAINAGNNDSIPAGITTDLLGATRIFNATVDLGAYEYQSYSSGHTSSTLKATICEGESFTFNNIIYTTSNNTAKDTFQIAGGCDSIVTLDLTVAQLNIIASDTTVCEGTSVTVSATKNIISADRIFDFDQNQLPAGWTSSGTAMFGNNTCGPSLDNSPYFWSSTSTTTPNIATPILDVCSGGSLQFDMRYAIQGAAIPCEGPDEADEGVSLEYSINGGATWVEFLYYSPNGVTFPANPGGNTSIALGVTPFTTWNTFTVPIPTAAVTTGTRFRWIQKFSSGGCCDNWGLDNIAVLASSCTAPVSLQWSNGLTVDSFTFIATVDTCFSVTLFDVNNNVLCTDDVCISVSPTSGIDAKTICAGQSYIFNGIAYTASNFTAKDTFLNVLGCDSIVTLNLTVNPYLTGVDVKSICQGQSYTFNNITYTTNNNTANDTLVGVGGCDSIVTLNLTVSPAITNTVNASICQGQTYSFGGSSYNASQSGIQHTFNTIAGCDSIVTLNLTVNPYLTGIDVKSICQGQSYTFNNITYTANNSTAKDTLQTIAGCDSIVTLNLTVNPYLTGTDVKSICQGQSYTFNNITYTASNNTAKDTLVGVGGCDSIVTLNLTVSPAITNTVNASICQGQTYSFGGSSYNASQSGIQHTFNTIAGCDSIVTLNLTVNPYLTGTDVKSICQGQSYTFNNITYTTNNNTAKDTLVGVGGCDSIVTLNLTVSPSITNTVNANICQGQTYSFVGSNYSITQSGIQHTFSTTSGCDSIVTLNLTVNPYLTGIDVKSICQGQSYTFNNITYTANNSTAKDTLLGAGGCDSIVTLNLTVLPAITNTVNASICQGQTFSFAGNTYNASQNGIQHTFSTTSGCDSIVTLNLTVNPYLTGIYVKSICQGQSYTFNNITYTANNSTAKDTLVGAGGCDSIVTLNLTVLPAITNTVNASICQGQTFSFAGNTYNASQNGIQHTFSTTSGCDSIVTLNLTVNPYLAGIDVKSICQGQSYSFNNILYITNNNTAKDTFTAINGCDSIVTLNLTVNPYLTGIDVKSICQGQSYTFNNVVYTANNNTATDTLQTALGCDSIITLNLTVVPATPNVVNVSICQGQTYSFAGNNYNATQNAIQHTFNAVGGCDSIVTLNLTVNPYLTGIDVQTICQGQSYTFNNVVYTASNSTATDTFQTALGCDSIVTLNLTVNPLPTVTVSPANQSLCSGSATNIGITSNVVGATYSWMVMQNGTNGAMSGTGNNISQLLTNTGVLPGTATYTILPTAAGCAGSDVTATITVNPIPVLSTPTTAQAICSGAAVAIPLSANIAGTTYSWTVAQNGVSGATAGTGNNITQTLINNGTVPGMATYIVTPTASGCAGTPISIEVTVLPKPTSIITPTSQTLCSGSATNIAFSSNVAGTTYSWTVVQSGLTGAIVGSGNTIAQTLNTTAAVTGSAIYTITPTANGCVGTSSSVTVTVHTIPATPIAITGADAPCAGSTQTYTTGTVTGATGYVWSLPPGWTGTSTTNSITVTVGSNNGSINVSANNTCGISPALTKSVMATPVLTPSVNIISDAPTLHCSGTMVNFTASITNGGTNPVYQWMRNGSIVGANANTYSYVPQDGDTISCTLTSNYPCLTSNNMVSNELIMEVTPTVGPELNIYVVENHLCSDSVVVLLATPTHGGSNPVYQWKLNNVNVGTNSVNYSYLPADCDLLSCQMTSNAICASQPTILSNIIPMTIVTVTNPAITLNVNPGSNLANGQTVTFTVNISGQGPAVFGHQIRWYKNDVLMGGVTGNSWTAVAGTDVFNRTRIRAELQSFSPCAFPKTATSNEVQIAIGTTGVSTKDLPDGFRAYPNPTASMVYFEGLEPGDIMIVRDIAGRILLQQEAKFNKEQVNLSVFAQGAYIVYFSRKDGKLWHVKIVKD